MSEPTSLRPATAQGKANMVPMVAVATSIAKGDPPEWLVLALANFQDFVGARQHRKSISALHRSLHRCTMRQTS